VSDTSRASAIFSLDSQLGRCDRLGMQHRSTSAVARKIAKFIKWKNASATELSHFIYVFIYFRNSRSRSEMEARDWPYFNLLIDVWSILLTDI